MLFLATSMGALKAPQLHTVWLSFLMCSTKVGLLINLMMLVRWWSRTSPRLSTASTIYFCNPEAVWSWWEEWDHPLDCWLPCVPASVCSVSFCSLWMEVLSCGVPQGTKFGPIVFIALIQGRVHVWSESAPAPLLTDKSCKFSLF